MALQGTELETIEQWTTFFVSEIKVSEELARKYATLLVDQGYCGEAMKHILTYATPGLPSPLLLDLGFKAGHALKLAMHFNTTSLTAVSGTANHVTKLNIPRPTVTLDANQTDFDQFCFEWKTYHTHYGLSQKDIALQLLYCGTEEVRRRIRIEHPSFTTSTHHSEEELLQFLKDIVLSKTSKIVHLKQFRDMHQQTHESSNEFLARLQLKASCCGFSCSHCGKDGSKERIKEQFILGLSNTSIQTAILKTVSQS